MRMLRRVVAVSVLLVLSKSQAQPFDDNVTAVPTILNTSMPIVTLLNTTTPSMAPVNASSLAPVDDGNATDAPTTITTVTDAPIVAPGTPTEAPIIDMTDSPVFAITAAPVLLPTDAPIHQKDEILDPKSKDPQEHGVGHDGISASAIFGMVVAIGLVFVGAFFVFGKRKGGGGRRDGMREMEMSTWVNNNDNDGLL